MPSHTLPEQRITTAEVSYPSVRYFQIHFEFLHEQFQKTLRMLDTLQVQMCQMEQQIADCTAKPMTLQNLENDKKSLSPSPRKSAKQSRL